MTESIIPFLHFLVLAGLILMFLGFFKVKKNIYIQAAFIAMGTLAVGESLSMLFFTYGTVSFILGFILTWPIRLANLFLLLSFDETRLILEDSLRSYFLIALVQYIGYLALLFGIRKVKVLYKKKKAARE